MENMLGAAATILDPLVNHPAAPWLAGGIPGGMVVYGLLRKGLGALRRRREARQKKDEGRSGPLVVIHCHGNTTVETSTVEKEVDDGEPKR